MDTQARVAAVKARLSTTRSALIQAQGFGPPCTDCRYRRPTQIKGVVRCSHFALAKHTVTITTGEVKEHVLETVDVARAEDGLCGPEALLFEPRNRLVKFGSTPWGFSVLLFGAGAVATGIGSVLGY